MKTMKDPKDGKLLGYSCAGPVSFPVFFVSFVVMPCLLSRTLQDLRQIA